MRWLRAPSMCAASALVSLFLCYVEKTDEARCYEASGAAARAKIPPSLPEILYWKPQIRGTEPYRLSSSATQIKLHRKACVCVRACVCLLWVRWYARHAFQLSFGFNHHCNQASCGFHSKKSKAKINDLQQVAMALINI